MGPKCAIDAGHPGVPREAIRFLKYWGIVDAGKFTDFEHLLVVPTGWKGVDREAASNYSTHMIAQTYNSSH